MCDCIITDEVFARFICVEDFDGSYSNTGMHTSFWADYDPEEHVTHYGGDWRDVPDLKTEQQPTEDEVWTHARAHMHNPDVLI